MTQSFSAVLLAGLMALACSSPEPEEPTAEQEHRASLERAEITLDAAPARIRDEVLKTCDKWSHIDRPCVDDEVRTAQLECWIEKGLPELQLVLRRRIAPRARDLNIMRQQNLCMELRRWRKLERGPDF